MSQLSKKNKLIVMEKLIADHPDAKCALDFGTVYQLLVATVLSAQTTDVAVNKATPALFAKAPDAVAMSKLAAEDVEEYIRKIGMYRQKAKNVVRLSQMLVEKYDGQVPQDFDALQELPGVGRKTANVVLSVGFGEQHIAVDTHVFRLANRIGLTAADDVLNTELQLMKSIPQEMWTQSHHALIFHGRQVCDARKPKCDQCCIADLCKRNNM